MYAVVQAANKVLRFLWPKRCPGLYRQCRASKLWSRPAPTESSDDIVVAFVAKKIARSFRDLEFTMVTVKDLETKEESESSTG